MDHGLLIAQGNTVDSGTVRELAVPVTFHAQRSPAPFVVMFLVVSFRKLILRKVMSACATVSRRFMEILSLPSDG